MNGDTEILEALSRLGNLQGRIESFPTLVPDRWDGPTTRDIDNRLIAVRDLSRTLCEAIETAEMNIALGRVATASSTYETHFPANAVDGDLQTRWSSNFADNQWLQIDLGADYWLAWARVHWEAAYARKWYFEIETAPGTWVPIYQNFDGQGGVEEVVFQPWWPAARQVRVHGIERATEWGFSLYEIELYGEAL